MLLVKFQNRNNRIHVDVSKERDEFAFSFPVKEFVAWKQYEKEQEEAPLGFYNGKMKEVFPACLAANKEECDVYCFTSAIKERYYTFQIEPYGAPPVCWKSVSIPCEKLDQCIERSGEEFYYIGRNAMLAR